jgi:CheY-like chemotaxis protein
MTGSPGAPSMKFGGVSARTLRRAIDIYLGCAYPGSLPPYSVRARSAFDENEPLENVLASEHFEVVRSSNGSGATRYLLRLGNDRYPHMRLGLASCAGDEEDFVFVVDTHDRHFRVDPNMPGGREFRELQLYNDQVKQEIERGWERENVPTQRKVLEDYDDSQCTVRAHPRRVLIVEDEALIAELERHILECDGYTVVVCLSGAEAVAAAENNHIDLCLLDIMMPDVDGFDVVRMLEERHLRRFPVVFVTAMPETRVDPAIADGFIAKPFEPQFLLKKVRTLIG